jgi:hypothetical protein
VTRAGRRAGPGGYGLLRVHGIDRVATDAGSVPLDVLLLADLAATRTLTAEVLWIADWKARTRNESTVTVCRYLAVDDGTSDRTTAWALPLSLATPVRTGELVELTVRPWSRRVTAVGPVGPRLPAARAG